MSAGLRQRRVLVVGAGRRVEETIVPALMCLTGDVEVVGVWARRSRKLSFYGGEFTVQTETSPAAFDLSQVDSIIVAVTRAQVPAVLAALAPYQTGHIALMLDTPVLDPGDFAATRAFRRFRRVVSSEDAIALPPVATARDILQRGDIGELRSVCLFHSGWRNHALASLRSFVGMRRPSRITVRRWNPKWSETRVRFGGVRASVIQPHVHGNGRLLVVGERGAIVDYETDRSDAIRIGYVVDGGVYRGSTIDGERVESERDERFFTNLPRSGLPNPTLDNMFKIRGFMELVAEVNQERPGLAYDAYDSIYDHQAMRLAERLPAFVDVALPGGRSVFDGGIRAVAGLARVARRG
jgi:predicted dehydrogenase